MTVGEALSLRAKQAQKLNDLATRIRANGASQEGTVPAENAAELIEEYLTLSQVHSELVEQISRTNANTALLGLLQEREVAIRRRNLHALAATSAQPRVDRYMRSELRYVSHLDVPEQQRLKDGADEVVRGLDARIQALNWETELV